MTTEIRYIVFTTEEARRAIASFIGKQYHIRPEDVRGMEIIGHDESPGAVVHLPAKPINIATTDLVGVLLLYCRDHHIPVPQRSQKNVRRSAGGLTLELATDLIEGRVPLIVNDRVTYQDMAATQELDTVRQELTRALARAEQAERKLADADAKVAAAEKARVELAQRAQGSGLWDRIVSSLANRKQSV